MARSVVRYGIISTAQIALNRHIPAARESAKSEIVAISSRDEAKARQAAIYFRPSWKGPSPGQIQQSLREGEPPIYIRRGGYGDEIRVAVVTLQEGEERLVASRLKEVLHGH